MEEELRGLLSVITVSKGRGIAVFKCDYCGKTHQTPYSHFIRRKRHFCSPDCYADYRHYFLPKEDHNRYGCGLSAEERDLRIRCRSIFNHAIRSGLIKRGNCKVCKESHAEGHHKDYTKPLEVDWFCFKHHREHHATLKRQQK